MGEASRFLGTAGSLAGILLITTAALAQGAPPKKGKSRPKQGATATAPPLVPAAAPPVTTTPASASPASAPESPAATDPVAAPASTDVGPRPSPSAMSFTLERVSAYGHLGWASNDLSFGLGAGGGYTLRQGIHIGGIADYWFGTSQTITPIPGAEMSVKSHGLDLFAIGGYDFGMTPKVVLRPYAGVGIFWASGEACTTTPNSAVETCVSTSGSKGAGTVGGQVLYDVGSLFVGGGLRFIVVSGDVAVAMNAEAGGTF